MSYSAVPKVRGGGSLLSRGNTNLTYLAIGGGPGDIANIIKQDSGVDKTIDQDRIVVKAMGNPREFIEDRNHFLDVLATYVANFTDGLVTALSTPGARNIDVNINPGAPISLSTAAAFVSGGAVGPHNMGLGLSPNTRAEMARGLGKDIYEAIVSSIDPLFESVKERMARKMENTN